MSSDDFQRLTIRTKPGRTEVRERARVTGERVMLSVEETRDPVTGEPVLRGVEYIERTVEREGIKAEALFCRSLRISFRISFHISFRTYFISYFISYIFHSIFHFTFHISFRTYFILAT